MVAVLEDPPMFDVGGWLVEQRRRFDLNEARWLEVLAAWDRDQGWALDGQLSGADWLRWRAKLCRSTAFEKLQIAHQLQRRPIIKDAFAAGQICYSAVRLICRLDDVTPAVDQALAALASQGSVLELEQAIRHYQLHHDQDPPGGPRPDAERPRGVRITTGLDGTGTAEITLTDTEAKELAAAVRAFADPAPDRQAVNARADSDPQPAPADPVPFWQRKADAFMDLVRTALAHAHDGHAMGADRYQLHLVVDAHRGQGQHLDGTPLNQATLDQVRCDCSTVNHLVENGEPLAIGRNNENGPSPNGERSSYASAAAAASPAVTASTATSTTSTGGNTAATPTSKTAPTSATATTPSSTPKAPRGGPLRRESVPRCASIRHVASSYFDLGTVRKIV